MKKTLLNILVVLAISITWTLKAQNDNQEFDETFTQADLSILTGNVQRPNGIGWVNDTIYAVCNGDWTVYEIDDTNGDTRTYIHGIRNSHDLHAEENENGSIELWIPDYEQNTLFLVNPARSPQVITDNLESPWGIEVLDEETFIITNLGNDSIVTTTRSGEITVLNSDMRSPAGITVNEDFVFVANNGSARRAIEWFDRGEIAELSEGETIETVPLVSGLQNTTGLTMGEDGYLYFTYALGTRGVVGRIDPEMCIENGGCSNDEIDIVVYTEIAAPLAGLTVTPDMRLFIHTIYRPEIYWIQLETPDISDDIESVG